MESTEILETGPGALRALAMVAETLRGAGLEREQIDCVAVGIGPGSYTGIRAAIALAQGWQLAGQIRLLGICSMECLIAEAAGEGLIGRVACVVDAQRDEFYVATYELAVDSHATERPGKPASDSAASGQETPRKSGSSAGALTKNWRELEPLRLASLTEVRERARAGECLIGPEANRWSEKSRAVFPRASTAAKLAQRRRVYEAGERLEPIYLRPTNFVKAQPARWKY